MKNKILNIFAIGITSIFLCAVAILIIIGLVVFPKETLTGLGIVCGFFILFWSAFRTGQLVEKRKIDRKLKK